MIPAWYVTAARYKWYKVNGYGSSQPVPESPGHAARQSSTTSHHAPQYGNRVLSAVPAVVSVALADVPVAPTAVYVPDRFARSQFLMKSDLPASRLCVSGSSHGCLPVHIPVANCNRQATIPVMARTAIAPTPSSPTEIQVSQDAGDDQHPANAFDIHAQCRFHFRTAPGQQAGNQEETSTTTDQ